MENLIRRTRTTLIALGDPFPSPKHLKKTYPADAANHKCLTHGHSRDWSEHDLIVLS